ncbi:MAG: hypothetical protein J7465_16255 [Chloroflexus sp.]|nr:hypothetical protein [Chloroflexus sp.]
MGRAPTNTRRRWERGPPARILPEDWWQAVVGGPSTDQHPLALRARAAGPHPTRVSVECFGVHITAQRPAGLGARAAGPHPTRVSVEPVYPSDPRLRRG